MAWGSSPWAAWHRPGDRWIGWLYRSPWPVRLRDGRIAVLFARRQSPLGIGLIISEDLARWNWIGRMHEVLLRFCVASHGVGPRLRFNLNGVEMPDALRLAINSMYMMAAPRFRVDGY